MTTPRSSAPSSKKRRSFLRSLLTLIFTTAFIATGGFGAFPDNSLTDAFQDVLALSIPPEILNPLNGSLKNISSPLIVADAESAPETKSTFDPVGSIISWLQMESQISSPVVVPLDHSPMLDATMTALGATQTQQSIIQSQTPILTSTKTAIPSLTPTSVPSDTPTVVPTWTFQFVFSIPKVSTPTNEPEDMDEPPPSEVPTEAPTEAPSATPVPTRLVLYVGDVRQGDFGPRSSADGLCYTNLPPGFSNFAVFASFNAVDSIANMPSNFGLPTTLPIQSASGIDIANDWSDLMDGSIDVSLLSAGVLSLGDWWWSGSEDGFGNHIDGTTENCSGWLTNSGMVGGYSGYYGSTTATWIRDTNAGCGDPLPVLCIAY